MKKTLFYLLILILILGGAWLASFLMSKNSLSSKEGSNFTIKDTAAISRIVIKNRNKSSVSLVEQENGTWRVNDLYKARPDAIETLLKTFAQMKVLYPVGKSARKEILKLMDNPMRTVEVYLNEEINPVKTYYIGAPTSNNKGTFGMLEGAADPYVISLPGFEGQLVSRFFTILEEWRTRIVYDYKADQIDEITFNYVEDPQYSFRVQTVSQDSFIVQQGLEKKDQPVSQQGRKVNQAFAKEYVGSFKKLFAEAFENTHPKIDSIRATKPFLVMNVRTKSGHERTVDVHYMKKGRRTKGLVKKDGIPMPYDQDRYFAFINKNQDLVMIQHYVFEKVLKKYNDFLME